MHVRGVAGTVHGRAATAGRVRRRVHAAGSFVPGAAWIAEGDVMLKMLQDEWRATAGDPPLRVMLLVTVVFVTVAIMGFAVVLIGFVVVGWPVSGVITGFLAAVTWAWWKVLSADG